MSMMSKSVKTSSSYLKRFSSYIKLYLYNVMVRENSYINLL
nr:MAG TPA: hypothetical protein [Crassvirales sp.]